MDRQYYSHNSTSDRDSDKKPRKIFPYDRELTPERQRPERNDRYSF